MRTFPCAPIASASAGRHLAGRTIDDCDGVVVSERELEGLEFHSGGLEYPRSGLGATRARRYADARGMKDIARSASAVMVRAGFTPGLAEMAEPSIT